LYAILLNQTRGPLPGDLLTSIGAHKTLSVLRQVTVPHALDFWTVVDEPIEDLSAWMKTLENVIHVTARPLLVGRVEHFESAEVTVNARAVVQFAIDSARGFRHVRYAHVMREEGICRLDSIVDEDEFWSESSSICDQLSIEISLPVERFDAVIIIANRNDQNMPRFDVFCRNLF
jgi:hypothetical protein